MLSKIYGCQKQPEGIKVTWENPNGTTASSHYADHESWNYKPIKQVELSCIAIENIKMCGHVGRIQQVLKKLSVCCLSLLSVVVTKYWVIYEKRLMGV